MDMLGKQGSLPHLLQCAIAADLVDREQAERIYLEWRRAPQSSLASHLSKSAGLAREVVAELEVRAGMASPTHPATGASLTDDAAAQPSPATELPRDVETFAAASRPNRTAAPQQEQQDPEATILPSETLVPEPSPHVRFRKLRAHREGGLGAVSVAEDAEVPRQVALKEIRPAIADDASARQQFLFEARVTGALEHPGVVPVYGCGVYRDGRPYYAMRFIEGDDLHDVTAAFHRARDAGAPAAEINLQLRQLLGRIVAVAQVLDYAHSRGVIHRDLKPKNIMVGAYGETLVVDWGLAKQIDDVAESDAVPSASAAPLPSSLSDSLEQSRMGTAKGTICYMSPEQALGRVDLTGPSLDIYGLGATLYHVLSGKPPGASLPPNDLLRHVQKGELPRLREVAPWVPRPLEAICSKAMAHSPVERYASAGELARDVERWLADEPVSAMPEPWTARAARWLRQHRTWAVAAMASLLAITAVTSVLLWRVNQARRAEREARREATRLLAMARGTTDSLLNAASEQLRDIPEAEEVRRRLLVQAANSYREFLEMRATNPELREQAGWVQIRLSEVQRELGDLEEAAQTVQRATADFRTLIDEGYAPLTARLGLAEALRQRSEIATDLQRLEAATAAIDQAIAELTGLVQEHPRRGDLLEVRGRARIQQGVVAHDTGDLPSAIDAFQAALADLQAAADLQPGEDATERMFFAARAAVNLGHALSRTDASDEEVERAYRAGLQDAARLFNRDPAEARFADLLGRAEANLGDHLVGVGKLDEAAEVYQQGHDRYQRLVERHPRIPRYRHGLILSLIGLAEVAQRRGDSATSERHLRRAVTEAEVLGEYSQSVSVVQADVALPHWTLTKFLVDSERWAEAAQVITAMSPAVRTADVEQQLGASTIDLQIRVALARGDVEGAQEILNQWRQQFGSNITSSQHYNAACFLSRIAMATDDSERKETLLDQAILSLRSAAAGDLGQATWQYAASDPDLQPLVRRHPELFPGEAPNGGENE